MPEALHSTTTDSLGRSALQVCCMKPDCGVRTLEHLQKAARIVLPCELYTSFKGINLPCDALPCHEHLKKRPLLRLLHHPSQGKPRGLLRMQGPQSLATVWSYIESRQHGAGANLQ